jgi:hypothetical protein
VLRRCPAAAGPIPVAGLALMSDRRHGIREAFDFGPKPESPMANETSTPFEAVLAGAMTACDAGRLSEAERLCHATAR